MAMSYMVKKSKRQTEVEGSGGGLKKVARFYSAYSSVPPSIGSKSLSSSQMFVDSENNIAIQKYTVNLRHIF